LPCSSTQEALPCSSTQDALLVITLAQTHGGGWLQQSLRVSGSGKSL